MKEKGGVASRSEEDRSTAKEASLHLSRLSRDQKIRFCLIGVGSLEETSAVADGRKRGKISPRGEGLPLQSHDGRLRLTPPLIRAMAERASGGSRLFRSCRPDP